MIPSVAGNKKGSVFFCPKLFWSQTLSLVLGLIVAVALLASCAQKQTSCTFPTVSENVFLENLALAEEGSPEAMDIVISYYEQEQEHLDVERWKYKKSTLKKQTQPQNPEK